MNWFKKSDMTRQPLEEVAKEKWHRDLPHGYELVRYEDGSWAVLRPQAYEDEPESKREVKRREMPNKDWSSKKVKEHVVNDALNRIEFMESDNKDENEDEDYWKNEFQKWKNKKQVPASIQNWALNTVIKHATAEGGERSEGLP